MDDVAIYCSSRTIATTERRLQDAINRLSRWARENGFTFFPDKAKRLHFTRLRGLHPDPCSSLRNRVLPFAPILEFLGLILHSKLSREPHMRYLRVKCERPLNILNVLSGRSWGGDRMVLLRLCHALIRYNID
jgi:hypothetical protein